MKKLISFSALILICSQFYAQIPQAINYQAVYQDQTLGINKKSNVAVIVSIIKDNPDGIAVFTEVHSTSINEKGIFSLQIGTINEEDFVLINWSTGPYFLRINVNGTDFGTSQILSVPYALIAHDVINNDDSDADPTNELQQISISNDTITLSNGGKLKLPEDKFEDNDNDPLNEIQSLSIVGDTLILSHGGSIVLPKSEANLQIGTENKFTGYGRNGRLETNGNISISGIVEYTDLIVNKYDTIFLTTPTSVIRVMDSCIINGVVFGSALNSGNGIAGGSGGGGGGTLYSESSWDYPGENGNMSFLNYSPFNSDYEFLGGVGGQNSLTFSENLTGQNGNTMDSEYIAEVIRSPSFIELKGAGGGIGGRSGPPGDSDPIKEGFGGGGLYLICETLLFSGNINLSGGNGGNATPMTHDGSCYYGTSAIGGYGGGGGGVLIINCREFPLNSGTINIEGGSGGSGANGEFRNACDGNHIYSFEAYQGGNGGNGWSITIINGEISQ